MLRKSISSSTSSTSVMTTTAASSVLFTSKLSASTQLNSMPTSTSRKPKGPHRGPGKRGVSKQEEAWYKYVKKWELEMAGEWEPLEKFQHLPKPKKLIGNEACEIVWPYAVLLENVIKIHPFTKSIYVYYPQHSISDLGAKSTALARRFSRECLIPICFHNNQCYVESEMLLEHSDTAWIVIHCLDGRTEVVRVDSVLQQQQQNESQSQSTTSTTTKSQDEYKVDLLRTVLKTATDLGTSVKNPEQISLQLNERPLQNGFIRVDYQWMGETPEERQSHLVRWIDPEEKSAQPIMYNRESRIADWLNLDDMRPVDPRLNNLYKQEATRSTKGKQTGPSVLSGYFQTRYQRISSSWSRTAGRSSKDMTE